VRAELPDAPVLVDGWEPGLRLIADNLVENAARHGRREGRVRVTLAVPDGVAELIVDDDGRGVPEADRARIFAPFARLEATESDGSGLGLALVEQQARQHGARIDVGDSPLGGARFSVAFRARPPGAPTTASS
jgi:two-component system, OmpR family, sensor histidine kinase PrrB